MIEPATTSTAVVSGIMGQTGTPCVKNFFYFNGYLSGILLKAPSTTPQLWPFSKGFSACIWFNLSHLMTKEHAQLDSKSLPVLFNCYSAGFGGFECYFKHTKLFYRILPPQVYTPPSSDSNGVEIAEFQPDRWNYLAIEHEKPFISRAQLLVIVNEK